MKFSIERKDLMENIQYLANIVPGKNTMPILMNYLIEADAGSNSLRFTATDLEITVVVSFPANVWEGGRTVVLARPLHEIIHAMPDAVINFAKEEDNFHIQCQKSEYTLLCADAGQFPLVPEQDLSKALQLDAGSVTRMIEKTLFAVSPDTNRPIFTGIYWQLNAEQQTMVSTDGKKIAEYTISEPLMIETPIEQILPVKGLSFLMRVIKDDEPVLKAVIETSRVMFAYKNFTIFTHVIEGKYPDYRQVFPKEINNSLLINRDVLKAAIRRVSLIAPEESMRVKIDVSANGLDITTLNREMGEAHEQITDYEYSGEDLSIAFNYKYINSILDAIDTVRAKIVFGRAKDPVLFFNEVDPEDATARFLLMPLRLA
jgi:DNA polymerase-3 subunit beta